MTQFLQRHRCVKCHSYKISHDSCLIYPLEIPSPAYYLPLIVYTPFRGEKSISSYILKQSFASMERQMELYTATNVLYEGDSNNNMYNNKNNDNKNVENH